MRGWTWLQSKANPGTCVPSLPGGGLVLVGHQDGRGLPVPFRDDPQDALS